MVGSPSGLLPPPDKIYLSGFFIVINSFPYLINTMWKCFDEFSFPYTAERIQLL